MAILSIPRPNGSIGEKETRQAICNWLSEHGIRFRTHQYRLYPYFFEMIGLWVILSQSLLAIFYWSRLGWATFFVALICLAGGTLDMIIHLPLVTRAWARSSENILIEFTHPTARQEIIFSAHYDSKTELLDHYQRLFLLKNLRLGLLLTIILGLSGPLDYWLLINGSRFSNVAYMLGIGISIPLLLLAWGLGLNLSLGRFLRPSQGAVDNGAACAILLGLADRFANRELSLYQTSVTIALFSGEEVNMQGSHAYVLSREWPLNTIAVNLEVMAQNGEYVFWEQDGNVFKLQPTSSEVNQLILSAVEEVTGQPARPVGPVTTDAASFLALGIPASTLGTYDRVLKDAGFHRPTDNLGRVVIERLPEGVEILSRLLTKYDHMANNIV